MRSVAPCTDLNLIPNEETPTSSVATYDVAAFCDISAIPLTVSPPREKYDQG